MEKQKHALIALVILGLFIFIGPIITLPKMAALGFQGIPKTHWFILIAWLLYILITGIIVQKIED